MNKLKKHRILKSEKILPAYLEESSTFYVVLAFEDYLKNPFLNKYGLPHRPSNDFTPLPKGSVTKANLKGKFVRKHPEEKEDKKVHIKYTRKKDGAKIEYDRIFNVYVKELLHHYNISLSLKENAEGQKMIVSPLLIFDNSPAQNIKNTHVINLFCELFNSYEILTPSFEFAIPFNKQFEQELLPKGKLNEAKNFDELVEVAGRVIGGADKTHAFIERLKVIREYNPDILGKGAMGFRGYIILGFSDSGVVILEHLYHGNATYIFDANDYEKKIIKDKQEVLENGLYEKRFFHHDNWEPKIRAYLSSLKS